MLDSGPDHFKTDLNWYFVVVDHDVKGIFGQEFCIPVEVGGLVGKDSHKLDNQGCEVIVSVTYDFEVLNVSFMHKLGSLLA
jgi:hypothetical protein